MTANRSKRQRRYKLVRYFYSRVEFGITIEKLEDVPRFDLVEWNALHDLANEHDLPSERDAQQTITLSLISGENAPAFLWIISGQCSEKFESVRFRAQGTAPPAQRRNRENSYYQPKRIAPPRSTPQRREVSRRQITRLFDSVPGPVAWRRGRFQPDLSKGLPPLCILASVSKPSPFARKAALQMEQVRLKDFIKNTLVDIGEAVNEANQHFINPKQQIFHVFSLRHNKGDQLQVPGIVFDVAVTAMKNQKDKVGLMVTLLPFAGGGNTETAANNELVHRVKFEIGIEDKFIGNVPGRES